MEEFKQRFLEEWWPQAKAFIDSLSMEHWMVIGGTAFLLLLLPLFFRKKKNNPGRKGKKVSGTAIPNFRLEAFQIAPMGKDAHLRIFNFGTTATLSTLAVQGRQDILIKNALAGHQVHSNTEYGILLEVNSLARITPDFKLHLTYMDEAGNVYQQLIELEKNVIQKPKLIKSV
jgi:hypothetical protein